MKPSSKIIAPLIFFAIIYSKHFELWMCKFSKKFVKYCTKYPVWLIHPLPYLIPKKPAPNRVINITLTSWCSYHICKSSKDRHSKILFMLTKTVLFLVPFTMIKFICLDNTIYLSVCFPIADNLHGTIQFDIQHCHMLS